MGPEVGAATVDSPMRSSNMSHPHKGGLVLINADGGTEVANLIHLPVKAGIHGSKKISDIVIRAVGCGSAARSGCAIRVADYPCGDEKRWLTA